MYRSVAVIVFILFGTFLKLTGQERVIPVIQVTSVWDMEHLAKVKKQLRKPFYAASYEALLQEADDWLKQEPLSVMMKKQVPASGDKHDYMSIARYYWPDPSKPDGLPYINKDGEVNPEIFDYDRYPLGQMVDRVIALTLAWYFSGEERYAAEATKQVRVWFLDKDTRMNPNLEYSQVVMGKDNNKGRSSGLIDTYSFIEMLEAVTLLEKSRSFTEADSKALKAWFEQLTEWMLTSPQGRKEAASANNHSVSYDTQIIAFALYSGNRKLAEETIKTFPEKRLFRQVEPDGSQPQELRRTLAFHYSRENLTHVINIMLMAKRAGLPIDRLESADGRSFYKAIDFLTPYVEKGQEAWPYQQISGWEGEVQSFCKDLYRIASCLNPAKKEDYLRLFRSHHVYHLKDRFNLLFLDEDLMVEANKLRPQKAQEYDVYLLIGQSNMAGRGTMTDEDRRAISGVWLLNDEGNIEPAVSPLNKYSSIRKDLGMQQVSPADYFSRTLSSRTGRKILLVVNARGGSAIREWMPHASQRYFSEALRRAQQAQRYGTLRGILWHQGESDSGKTSSYMDSLQVMVAALRDALSMPQVPFVAGEIAPWHANRDRFNPVIRTMSEHIPFSAWVSSEGCTPLKDEKDPHFSREGQHLLGVRYAEKIWDMVYAK